MALQTQEKQTYQSIQKVKTFTPPSCDKKFVFAQLCKNIENACIKARRYKLTAKEVIIFLRTQDFRDHGLQVRLTRANNFPNEIIKTIEPAFDRLFAPNTPYRSTGAWLLKLEEQKIAQQDLFGESLKIEKMTRLFASVDKIKQKYGKHTLFLGSSFLAHKAGQHAGERGDLPQRKINLLPGETARKRLDIPMFMQEVK